MEHLYLFSAGSANDGSYKHLWLTGASLFIPQINKLLEQTDYQFKITDIQHFYNNESIILGNLLETNGSDKSTSHNYHIFYSHIFNKLDKNKNMNILEIGLGTNNPSIVSSMGVYGKPGASLRAFRDYLPNSNIYGGDIDEDILFECDRIKTCFVDQINIETFENMQNKFGNTTYDLIIDDGLHSICANLNTLLFALENINPDGWIVIEDIHIITNWKCIDFILSSSKKYKTYIINAKGGYLYAIHKLL
jgi:hypothetical protein